MSTLDLSALLAQIEADNVVTADEVLQMRRSVWGDNNLDVVEADALFRINDSCHTKPVEWADFFVTGMTDFLVRQTMPRGYIDEANATWLIQRISRDGVVETQTEMALLMNVLKHAENVTPRLEQFALNQVKESVLNGTGILSRGGELKPGTIGEPEVKMLRAILYSCGGAGGHWITRAEAEVLFELNDATCNADNHDSWADLFRAGIANHLMMLCNPEKVNVSEALRRETWLESDEGLSRNLGRSFEVYRKELAENGVNPRSLASMLSHELKDQQIQYSNLDTTGVQSAERVDASEAAWLIDRLNRDGKLTDNETLLLNFLRDDCPEIHESLKQYIRTAA